MLSCRWPFLLLVAMATACAGPPPPLPPLPDLLAGFRTGPFPGAPGLLQGFSPTEDTRDWRVGDAALFALELHKQGQVTRWLVRVEVEVPEVTMADEHGAIETPVTTYRANVEGLGKRTYTSVLFGARIKVNGADGSEIGSTALMVPREFLARGFTDACQAMEEPTAEDPDQKEAQRLRRIEAAAESMQSLVALIGIIARDDHLSDILWQVVRKPSILSVIWNLGVKIGLQPRFQEAVRTTALPPHLPLQEPTWVVPFTVTINDSPALYADLLVTTAHPPWMLCGGIVGITGRHPDDPELRFEMTLLAARRVPARKSP